MRPMLNIQWEKTHECSLNPKSTGCERCYDNREEGSKRLSEDESRLFSSDKCKLEVVLTRTLRGQHRVERGYVQDVIEYENLISQIDVAKNTFLFIRQDNSWGRFSISSELFRRIFAHLDVFPPFLDYVHAFGFKVGEYDENFGGYHRRIYRHTNANGGPNSFEFAYNLRYVEKHGRDLVNPWSVRHMAVYHQFDAEKKSSKWIFLHPSAAVRQQLEKVVSEVACPGPADRRFLHLMFLWSTEKNWRDYVNYFENEFKALEEKALFSRVGVKMVVDYDIAFADVQKLQHLCKKIGKCLGIFDTLLEIASGHQYLWNDIQNGRDVYADFQEIDSELKMYSSRIRNHRQSVDNLLSYSKGIASILAHILEFRNDELLIKNSEELHRSSESAREIATAAKAEQGAVALILAKAQNDSSLVKILTFVALLYLPASLIASLFSSNLIQLPSAENSLITGKLGLRISKIFWLYPVLTVALMVLTLILVVVSARWMGLRKAGTKKLFEAEATLESGTAKA